MFHSFLFPEQFLLIYDLNTDKLSKQKIRYKIEE